jgi:hypothetical protein
MESLKTYCFDFVDHKCHSVNTPPGWKLFAISGLNDFLPPTRLASMELCMGVKEKDILPGEYAVPEGLCFRISTPHQGDAIVTIPRRACSPHAANALPELLMAQGVITGHGVGAQFIRGREINDRKFAREDGLPGPTNKHTGKKDEISDDARTQRIQALQVGSVN